MKYKLLTLAIFGLFISCEQPKKMDELHENAEGEITVGKNFVVDRPIAILVNPTEEQLKLAKAELGSDYNAYYEKGTTWMTDASKTLEEQKIETIDRLANEIITFHTKEGKLHDVNLTDKDFALILFNGKDEPKAVTLEELNETYIQNYMQ